MYDYACAEDYPLTAKFVLSKITPSDNFDWTNARFPEDDGANGAAPGEIEHLLKILEQ